MEMDRYGLSRSRGYLSHYEIDEIILPPEFAGVKQAAANLSGLLSSGRVRHWLNQVEDPQLEALSSGQKLLLRMGSDHANTMKETLRGLRDLVTAM